MATFSVAVVTAAPPGQAAEGGGAFVKVDGREALLRSVELFLNRDNVTQIQLVVSADAAEETKRKFGGNLGFLGVKLVVSGVKWLEQVAAAGATLSPDVSHVLVHDAARPLVPQADVDAVMDAAEKHPVVGLVAAVRSTLVEVDEGGNAMAYHLPGGFMHLLTPQAFTRQKFMELASSGRETHPSEVTLVKGSPLNVRVGGAGDATLAKAMLNLLPKPKSKAPSNPFEEAQW